MRRTRDSAYLERTFTTLVECARAGERCPINGEPFIASDLLSALAHAGRIRVEVYPHNFRRVVILAGPDRGRATAAPPNKKSRPYKIIGRDAA